jgi:hypothetical protein
MKTVDLIEVHWQDACKEQDHHWQFIDDFSPIEFNYVVYSVGYLIYKGAEKIILASCLHPQQGNDAQFALSQEIPKKAIVSIRVLRKNIRIGD